MAWIYLAESVESDRPWDPGSELGPIVKTTDSPQQFCCHGWPGEKLIPPQSGAMCKHCGAISCQKSTLYLEVSPARTSALQALALAWEKGREADFSAKSSDWLAIYDQASSSWKMSQLSLFEAGGKLLERLPNWGMTAGLSLWQLRKLEPLTGAIDGGAWPTPQASQISNDLEMRSTDGRANPNKLGWAVGIWRTPDTGSGGTSGRLARGEKARPSGAAITMRLDDQVKAWPTPTVTSNDNRKGASPTSGDGLQTAAKAWPTPSANDHKGENRNPAKSGQKIMPASEHNLPTRAGVHQRQVMKKAGASTSKNILRLNPRFVEALLGYSPGVTELEPWAIAWIGQQRGKRSKS